MPGEEQIQEYINNRIERYHRTPKDEIEEILFTAMVKELEALAQFIDGE